MHRVEYDGYTFHVPDVPTKEELERGVAQPFIGEMDLLAQFFEINPERNRVMIDVGGHIGMFAVPYSKYFNTIFSYEPHDANYDFLLKNLAENDVKNVIPVKKAVMYGTERVNIIGHTGSGGLVADPKYSGMYTSMPDDEGNAEAIDLDDEHLFHMVDFIKVDVEGQEYLVLKSAEKILRTRKPFLQIEIKDHHFSYQSTKDQIYDYLYSLGYTLFKEHVDHFFI